MASTPAEEKTPLLPPPSEEAFNDSDAPSSKDHPYADFVPIIPKRTAIDLCGRRSWVWHCSKTSEEICLTQKIPFMIGRDDPKPIDNTAWHTLRGINMALCWCLIEGVGSERVRSFLQIVLFPVLVLRLVFNHLRWAPFVKRRPSEAERGPAAEQGQERGVQEV